MLWVDKYRPKHLNDLDYHDEISCRLESLAQNPTSLPHLFFYGPSGAGKRTRISAFLGALFGPSAHKLKLTQRAFTTPTGRTVDIHMISSEHHMELSPGDAGNNDRFVIQDVLKDIASSKNISSSLANMDGGGIFGSSNTKSNTKKETEIKVVVLNQVDKLSRQAQAALRRTMEKYAASCRLILCCESPSKLIAPLRSRCLGIRVGAPTEDQVTKILKMVAHKENLTLPNMMAVNLARESDRNLRKALLMLEAAKVQAGNNVIGENQLLPTADWELYIRQLANDVTKEQSPQTLMAAREKLYELLVNCIPATIILKTLVGELLNNLDDSVKLEVIEWAAFYEHRLALGSKDIFHLEAFLAKYMAIYKKYLNDLFG
ncbi:replication factor C small subunit [Nitzschia inconspicua]|uniref:Replication factor C small subunit n=1 Tax=Nitzschia inconspicua TaxID=303405 RepID=A0A9K3PGK2_9STRA|nr:replication factor C small subunit [Nitzschia inconspicua]